MNLRRRTLGAVALQRRAPLATGRRGPGGAPVPRLLGQSEYNQRLKSAAPLMEAALRWLAGHTPGSAELLRLMDATPVGCGQAVITARRSDLFGHCGCGYSPHHSPL